MPVIVIQKRRFHSQNASFEMSAPIGIGVKISAGRDASLNRRIDRIATRCEYVDVAIVLFAPFVQFCDRIVSVSKSYRPVRRGNCTTRRLPAPHDMV